MWLFANSETVNVDQTKSVLQNIGDTIFNGRSFMVFVVSIVVALILGSIIAALLRRLGRAVGRTADASRDLGTVNRLRSIETWITLSTAIIRLLLIMFAVYFWWVYTHPTGSRPSAIIGASAVAIIIVGGIVGPLLRDFAFGAGMIAEHWFSVGDLIAIETPNVQGVVERITLRSTRLRSLNGETIWVANQNMNGVRVARKGVWPTAIELFVTDPVRAEEMVDTVNKLLPGGLALLASPLRIIEVVQRDETIWHITAVGETTPGREWILTDAALNIFKQLDEKSKDPLLIVNPVARYADKDTERLVLRAVKNAKKKHHTFTYRRAIVKDEREAYQKKSSEKLDLDGSKANQ